MQQLAKEKYKSGVKWLTWSAVLAVVSLGGWLVYTTRIQESSQSVEVRLLTVERDTLEEVINESGTVELAEQQTLKAPADGTVEKILVEVGDFVTSGKRLIVLRDPEAQTKLADHQLEIQRQEVTLANAKSQVTAAQEKLKAAQAEVEKLKSQDHTGSRTKIPAQRLAIAKQELNLVNLRAKVTEAQEKLRVAQNKLEADQKLFAKGFIAENELQNQKDAVRAAQAELRGTQLEVSTALLNLKNENLALERIESELQQEIADAESELAQAEVSLQDAVAQLQNAQTQVRQEAIALEKLQLERQTIEQELQENVVAAPVAGQILDILVKKGTVVTQSELLLVQGNPTEEIIKLQLSTLDASKVESQQVARISVIGPNPETYTGRVEEISLLANLGSGDNSGDSSQAKVPAIVRLDNPTGSLIPGSQVSVEIIIEQQKNVLVLDAEAIQQEDDEAFVWLIDEQGRVSKQPVTLGLEALTAIQVKSGLSEGSRVAVPAPDTTLQPGMKVTTVDSEQ
ncbi:MAG: HlyD family efflux transporter periplasmic adaptor subunit [Oscillatoria sp. PMC 1051.18]|nr:HlyD family efflux transporter periplasmic adaptor subunit [Oscillatoria sp. PMC 1050.18]MEC5031512.1 HlyD family efflux transporter periplasmic adaptor subunit [Oscillatoria sp. PMC 1051.18]